MQTSATWRSLATLILVLLSSCTDRKVANEKGRAATARNQTNITPAQKPDGTYGGVQISNPPGEDVEYSQSLSLAPPKPSDAFTASVETMESMPPQFAVNITEKTALLKVKLDDLTPSNDQGVIVVKISSNGLNETGLPEASTVRAVLGKLRIGAYKMQVFLATEGKQNHKLSQTIELTAK